MQKLIPFTSLILAVFTYTTSAFADEAEKTISTGDKGVKYTISGSNTVVEVPPHSEVKINAKAKPEQIELFKGMARLHVVKSANKDGGPKFVLKTKTATMGVRGTDFMAVVNPILGESEIIVFEGNVDFTNAADAKDVKHVPAGHWGGVGGRFGAKTHDLIVLPKDALDHFNKATTVNL